MPGRWILSEVTIRILAVALFAGFCFFGGWTAESWRKGAEIDRLKLAQKASSEQAALRAANELQAAVLLGDELSARLLKTESGLSQLAEEKDHEIRRLTTGRRCLDGAAVRVLNESTRAASPALPPAAGEPLRADAAFATDTDVGGWANQARSRYDTCRARLDAIGDFYTNTPAYGGDGALQ